MLMNVPGLAPEHEMRKSAQSPMRPLQNSLPLRLLQAREVVMERFRPHLQANGLTEQQWRVLRALSEVGESEVTALADMICILPPSLSRILPDLEARTLITRRRAQGDKRASVVSLTREGQALFETMSKRSEAIYRDIETALETAGCPGILADLARLIEALQRHPAAPTESAGKPNNKLAKV